MKFSELGLSEGIVKTLTEIGYEQPTPIQEETIKLALEGRDVLGQAQTGTGKTAAFGLPTIEKINAENPAIQALVIAPTRELAVQGQEELFRFGKSKGLKVRTVFGGSSIEKQIKGLKAGAHIVVGTPGRLVDLIKRKAIKLDQLETLILDEADEMLNMGFLEDIESILKAVPDERQTLLFSATMPAAIKRIGVQFMTNPEHIQIAAKELTTDLVDQYYVRVRDFEKFDVLTRILDVQQPKLAIMFGRTKRRVDELTRGLELRGFNAAGIHGDLTQQKRTQVLKQFKHGEIQILVATDVAARGLDVSGVDYVYNFDIPQDSESYVHRIGRTGRAGAHGNSVTFVSNSEMDYLKDIEKLTKKRMQPLKPYTREEALAGRMNVAADSVADIVKSTAGVANSEQVDKLVEQYDAQELAAALLGAVANVEQMDADFKLSHERPLPHKHGNFRGGRRGGGRRGGGDHHRGGGYRGNRGQRERRSYDRGSRNGSGDRSQRGHSGSSRRQSRNFVIKNND